MKSKSTINVTGLNYRQILEMPYSELKKLNERDLAALASRAVSALNKRYRRIEKMTRDTRMKSPAVENLRERDEAGIGRPFSVRGKNRSELLNELQRMRQFEQAKTSTARGTKEFYEKFKDIIENADAATTNKFWSTFRDVMQGNASAIQGKIFGSEDIIRLTYKAVEKNPRATKEELRDTVEKSLRELYEEREEDEEEEDDEEFDWFDF